MKSHTDDSVHRQKYQTKNHQCRPYEAFFNRCRRKAISVNNRSKGKTWNITFEEFLVFMQEKVCHYCEDALVWPLPYGHMGQSEASNLDRKDNSIPEYSKENCVVCCPTCNRTKGSELSYEEMLLVGRSRRAVPVVYL